MTFHNVSNLSKGDQLLFGGFGRGTPFEVPHGGVVHRAFEAAVDAHPLALAGRHHTGESATSAELERRANALAHRLIFQ